MVTFTRTDFLIQFVWQPPKPEDQPKTPEELKAKIAEITKLLTDEEKTSEIRIPDERDVEKASIRQIEGRSRLEHESGRRASAAVQRQRPAAPGLPRPPAAPPPAVAPAAAIRT